MEKPRLMKKKEETGQYLLPPWTPEKLASRPEGTRMPSHQTKNTNVEFGMDESLAVKANRRIGEIGIVTPYNMRRPVGNGGLWSPGSSGARGTVGERRREHWGFVRNALYTQSSVRRANGREGR